MRWIRFIKWWEKLVKRFFSVIFDQVVMTFPVFAVHMIAFCENDVKAKTKTENITFRCLQQDKSLKRSLELLNLDVILVKVKHVIMETLKTGLCVNSSPSGVYQKLWSYHVVIVFFDVHFERSCAVA